MHISQQKTELRKSINERIARLTDAERHAEGRSLSRQLLPLIPEGSIVCGYFPLKTEADIRSLLLTLINRGDRVFLPRFEKNTMVFRLAPDLTNLPPGKFSIPEPLESAPLLDPEELQIALVPGRAFDKNGGRLGRGNGGFDRWIEKQRKANSETMFWGTCLECQLVNEVPMEEHDQRVDAIVTARKLYQIDN